MSNHVSRPPLSGILRQRGKIVGRVQLPRDAATFIEQFNRRYAALALRVEAAEHQGTEQRRKAA